MAKRQILGRDEQVAMHPTVNREVFSSSRRMPLHGAVREWRVEEPRHNDLLMREQPAHQDEGK